MSTKRIKGITIEIDGKTTGLDKAIQGSEKNIRSMNSSLREVDKLLKFDPGNMELLAQKQKILQDAIDETEKKLKSLKDADQQAKKQLASGNLGQEQYAALRREIIETEQKLDSLKKTAGSGSAAFEKISQVTQDFGNKTTALGKTLTPVSAGVAAAGTAAVKGADDLNSAVNTYLTATGTIAEQTISYADGTQTVIDNTQKFKDIISDIYNGNYGEGFEDIADALATVRKNMEMLNDVDLQKSTESAIALRDVFGYDISESTRAAATLIEQFGISADEAFNLIAQGSQNGLDYSGELLDSINEYSVQFHKAGIDAEGMFAVFKNGADSGAFNLDKIGDAVKELMIRVVDGSDTTREGFELIGLDADEMAAKFAKGGESAKQAFDETITALANTKDPLKQNQAGVDLLGTMWEDLGGNVVTSLNTANDAIDKTNDALGQIKEQKYDDLKNSLSSIGKTFISEIAVPIGEEIIPVLQEVVDVAGDAVSFLSELPEPVTMIITVIMALLAVLGPVLIIIGQISSGISAITGVMGLASTSMLGVVGIIALVIAAITAVIVVVKNWGTIVDWISDKWNAFKDFISGIWQNISETAQSIWNGISEFFKVIWDTIYSIFEVPLNLIKALIEGVFYAVQAIIITVWEVIKISLGSAWSWISQQAAAIFNPLCDFFSDIWNKVKNAVSDVWNSIKNILGGIWDGIYSKAKDAFGKVFSYIKDGFTNLKNTIGGVVKGVANAIISPIGSAVNGVISGVNWILDKVGSKKQFDKWKVPKFARGTGGLQKDTIGIVNDQKGPVYKEMIVPPHGKPFIPEGRDVVLPMEKGTKIVPANQTRSFLEQLPHFAKGIGDVFGGIWTTVKDMAGTVWDYITHPEDLLKIAVNKFIDFSNALEPGLSIAKGVVSTIFGSVTDFIKSIFDTITPEVKYNPSAGVEQWRELAAKALRMTGQYSEANLNRLLMQMQSESGGNPNAINNWDINAKRGTPSKGLMQVIDPTFQAYAMPGYNKNIYDPLSNILAAIKYTLSRYGSLANGWKGHGYAQGIGNVCLSDIIGLPLLDVQYFESGGILTKPAMFSLGKSIGVAGEGKEPEAITPISKLKDYVKDAVLEIIGEKDINITISLTQQIDKKTLAKELIPISVPLTNQYEKRQKRKRGVMSDGTSESYA